MQNKDILDANKKKKGFGFDPKKSGTAETYTVVEGDTLSKVAEKFYGNSERYKKLYDANKDAIGPDPDKIKVGQVLTIPPK